MELIPVAFARGSLLNAAAAVTPVGLEVGCADGADVGGGIKTTGGAVGVPVGCPDGEAVGAEVGLVGCMLG